MANDNDNKGNTKSYKIRLQEIPLFAVCPFGIIRLQHIRGRQMVRCDFIWGGATPHIATPFNMCPGEVIELVRVALNGKQHTTSECVAKALKRLHADAPQIKIVVSYADADQNHNGIIYQATNWIYLGKYGEGNRSAFIINGKKTHPRTIGSAGGVQSISWVQKHLDPNATEFFTKGKHKYIFVFNKRLRKKYLKQSKPYPKSEV